MAVRKIVRIDEELCDGCGDCVPACAEGAIQIIDGKAKLVSDTFCDGLGVCLGECPQNAITIEEREAPEFDEAAVTQHLAKLRKDTQSASMIAASHPAKESAAPQCGCPGSAMQQLNPAANAAPPASQEVSQPVMPSQLGHWPIQLMLVPPQAPFLKNADLLICADCVPFTVPDFHYRYLTGRALVVGCPKLDDLQHYYDKLKSIYQEAAPRSITVLKMEVPCCDGIAQAAVQARNEVAPHIPVEVHTIGVRGGIVDRKTPCESAA
ncbi:MAG: 4Fe-4S binding protein [Candidatus Zixiibacteriota bacterium]|nr:MAG: 4Fe-4S binding protein [candidate division Zixibacteria bacterium]